VALRRAEEPPGFEPGGRGLHRQRPGS